MKKRVYIIHGWEGSPDSNWFPWLKNELESQNFEVLVPQMPNPVHPKLDEWLEKMQQTIDNLDQNTYLIGHSLGVVTILRYLASLKLEQKIGGIVIVAGFPNSIGYDEIEHFTSQPLDYEKIKSIANKIIAIHSDNDQYVPLKQGEILKEKLNAELIVIPGAKHFNEDDGYTELPIVLEKLLEISK